MSGTAQGPYAGLIAAGVQQVKTLNLIAIVSGNPNGQVAGQAGSSSQAPDIVWDPVGTNLWLCIQEGDAVTTVWEQLNTKGADLSSGMVTATGSTTAQTLAALAARITLTLTLLGTGLGSSSFLTFSMDNTSSAPVTISNVSASGDFSVAHVALP